jgi:hypothetical protein
MDWDNAQGAPIAAAFIILLAIAALTGLTIAFQGHIHF